MPYNPDTHHRRSVRLKDYDYAQAGAYFVTICTYQRKGVFGNIVDGVMHLSDYGKIVAEEWERTPVVRPYVELDMFVVMPNHIHGITVISRDNQPEQTAHRQFSKPVAGSLPAILGGFKSAVTKRINLARHTPGGILWQRNYHEHIIFSAERLNVLRRYVEQNPLLWEDDIFHPMKSSSW